jgi:hypothetical protein
MILLLRVQIRENYYQKGFIMTTKQVFLSALILATANIALPIDTKDIAFTEGWNNSLEGENLEHAIFSKNRTKLDHIKIVEKYGYPVRNKFMAMESIGELKKDPSLSLHYQLSALRHIVSNNAISCSHGTIILGSTDIFDCQNLREEYEQFGTEKGFLNTENGFLKKKNNTSK